MLRRLIGPRALRIALASAHRYVVLPTLADDGAVRATLSEAGPDAAVAVELRMEEDDTLAGKCARCLSSFGPCAHVAILAADLAFSVPLREALLEGTSAEEAAARAPALRLGVHLELNFDGALAAWLAPAEEGMKVEIAASPFAELAPTLGKTYGDKIDPSETRIVSMVVRPYGERKLLTPREVSGSITFSPRDRRVLSYVRDRGAGRKATYAVGVEASLAIEAMRLHGGIFTEGYKGLLDFRSRVVRPAIALAAAGSKENPFDALSAFWIGDDTPLRIAFADSFFFSGPFPYVWTKSGAIYPVAADVDLDFVSQLARSPELLIPPGKLKAAGARLLGTARRKGISLPSHEAFGLPAPETPRLLLRLMGEPLDIEGELVAIYGGREFPLYPAANAAIDRDAEEEAGARAAVERSGLAERMADPEDEDEGPARVAVSGEAAVEFWRSGLLALRAETAPKIEVELARRLAHVRLGAPVTGRVHVTLEGDWLDTRLEFRTQDLPVELGAIREALARKQRWVVLDDGTITRISASIEALADEADEVFKGKSKGRLPAHQLGRLDRWVEENDGRIDAKVQAFRERLRALAVAAEPDLPQGLRGELRPYQKLGLAWLQFLQTLGAGGILADDMGLGKTITTLAFLLRRKELEGPMPSLVVCPTSVATNWVREIERFTPDLKVVLFHGAGRDAQAVRESDVVITTYALLRRDIAVLAAIPFRCAVLDEAQNIKNADSATTRAAGQLDAAMRLALSGTPIENRLGELWSLASFVNPGILGTARHFETRFERPIVADRKSPLAAELRAVVRPFLLRRTKDDVLRELPPKIEIDRVLPLNVRDKRMYDALAHTLRAGVAKDLENRRTNTPSLSVFTALTRLRQMACDPRLVDPSLPPVVSAKRKEFLELVRELVAEGRRALVFSQFVELLTLWRQDLDAENIAYEYLDGRTTKRDAVVTRFQEGKAPLFLISLKAGGVGLNLTAADTVIHCDPWWNPAVEDQATDRAYRIGQDKPVTVVRLIARGTIEEKILVLKDKKRELTKVVIGDDARALEGLTTDDLRALLGDAESDPLAEPGADEDPAPPRSGAPTDQLATARKVLSPDYQVLVSEVQRWLATTGRLESELASMMDMPLTYASRLARGEPFPCSRAVAQRIRAHLRSW